jgi:hypothetical protein
MEDNFVPRMEKRAFSAKDVAALSGCHINTIRSLLRKKTIGSIKISRKYIISQENFSAWINGNHPQSGAND